MVSIRDGSWENHLQMEDSPATFDDTGEYIPTVVKLSGTMGIYSNQRENICIQSEIVI